jgi:excinuclease ABC subunit A
VTNHKGPWQSATVQVHRLSEIDTPAFREFLAEAVRSFEANRKRLATKPEDLMPWKINGERWHLSDKGFPPGKKVKWDREVLSRLLAVLRSIEPGLTVSWEQRDAITLRLRGVSRGWAQVRTKAAEALDCRFLVKKGQLNLARVETLGAVEIQQQRGDADVLRLRLTDLTAEQSARLREVLAEQIEGFRATFAKGARAG